MLEVLSFATAIVTIVGGLAGAITAIKRNRAKRREEPVQEAPLIQLVTDYIGRALSAHGRLVTLGRLQASWLPVSESTATRFAEPLLREVGPIASLRTEIRFAGDSQMNQAADDILRVLEDSADLLTKRKRVLRRVDWDERESAIREAIHVLEEAAQSSA